MMIESGKRVVEEVDRSLSVVRERLLAQRDLRLAIDAKRGRPLDGAEVDRLKRDFLALISRDLGPSLRSIRAVVDLADGHTDAVEKNLVIGAVSEAHGRLESLVYRGLAYLDWLAHRPASPAVPTELTGVAATIRARVPRLCGPHVFFRVSHSGPCFAAIEERHVLEVLRILLHNAVDFSRGLVDIQLDVREVGDEIRLTVSDDGQGFPASLADDLFAPFSIGHPLGRLEGMGLGLALARAIVEAHRGRIGAQSHGPGTGSTFTVRLPACRGEQPSPTPTPG